MAQSAIKVTGLGKQYIIGGAELQHDSFREMLSNALKAPFQKYKTLKGQATEANLFWALDEVDFEVAQGDIVGVIGHNGAGKSTLLKVLSRITAPTVGEVAIRGRVASLLEVGTGFHPELTGRENIYLNGSILGMRRHQIEKYFDEIVEFAGIEKFLDTPVKRYSSGMYVRLAFSVAAHLDTDVLLMDEVLAVGDQKFQDKCLGMLGDAGSMGRTVLFVSHNLASVAKLCNRVIVMDHGKVVFDGDTLEGISVYNRQLQGAAVLSDQDYVGELYPRVKFNAIEFTNKQFSEGDEIDPLKPLEIDVYGECNEAISHYRSFLSVYKDGQLLFSLYDSFELSLLPEGKFRSSFRIQEKFLLPGEYTFKAGGSTDKRHGWLHTRDYRFSVAHRWTDGYDSTSTILGLVNIEETGKRDLDVDVPQRAEQ